MFTLGTRRTWRTFQEAEKCARRNFKANRGSTAIYMLRPGQTHVHPFHDRPIADISEDAYGRIWTDLSPIGAELV